MSEDDMWNEAGPRGDDGADPGARQQPDPPEASDPDAPGTAAAAEGWPDDPAEPNEPG
jgi:hypothetical protein